MCSSDLGSGRRPMKIAPHPENESARLRSLQELQILDTDPEEPFDELTKLAKDMFDVPIALISLVDEYRQWFKSKIGLDASEIGRDESFCAHALLDDELFIVEDATKDDRFYDNPLVVEGLELRFYAGVPLLTTDQMALGTLCLIDTKPRKLKKREKQALL